MAQNPVAPRASTFSRAQQASDSITHAIPSIDVCREEDVSMKASGDVEIRCGAERLKCQGYRTVPVPCAHKNPEVDDPTSIPSIGIFYSGSLCTETYPRRGDSFSSPFCIVEYCVGIVWRRPATLLPKLTATSPSHCPCEASDDRSRCLDSYHDSANTRQRRA